ncbi:hypothetical protein Tco_0505515 [Tanacetum coccineum]
MSERTMEELLCAPTEGYGEAIVLPEINAAHFEIKTNLLQLVQANPFQIRKEVSKPSGSWDELVVSVQCFPSNPSLPLFLYTISPLKGGLGLSDFQVGMVIGAGIGPSKSSQSLSIAHKMGLVEIDWRAHFVFTGFIIILLGFPGPSDGI